MQDIPCWPGASALAAALREALVMDRWARESLAARAIRHVRADYTKEMMCARTLALYQELLAEWRDRA